MRSLKWIAFVFVGLFVAASLARPVGPQTVEIASKTGVHVFAVEIVDNDADRAKGLMYRKELPEGQGMLFDFQRDQEVSFWMQNTYIPLDMIFIRGDGRILRISVSQLAKPSFNTLSAAARSTRITRCPTKPMSHSKAARR